ncbi:MAG TPA: DUF6519 domain-containing protein [Devosia sp.]|jgi:hypothetical protein|uniref:DUF6519 domain-containing protein n=1 Tax=Devosia sp. TaxID=1871048 RepID=UPI002DDD080A|nr:DUF6519 domain-containing protein [Devosia sp.]HEV2517990.1 DUF6519 domain-containing protein [Devosia sp.]
MATDFSRVRLNPLLDYAGVALKQGGVLLDADANELADILDRRLRALASDTLGRSTVSSTTPDAFKITAAGGTLQIGKGRLYVDGLLAENHGARSTLPAQRMFDELLAEPQFTNAIGYAAQPYLPQAPALPTAGRHLVYLDVWNREVTFLEEPKLVESAVGVETASRIQTVWQVRTLADNQPASVTCATPDADVLGWDALTAPSTGVLSTGTFDVAPANDPCELPPTGGYRGLENQLYRVEIHDAGTPGGGATFKWSRENASVGSRVTAIVSASELELESLGRDDVLSFKNGDWVEIIDDAREFAQLPGEMRKITVVAASRRITFGTALPAALAGADPAGRNLRVRRWDQANLVFRVNAAGNPAQIQDLNAGSSGVIAIPAAATTFILENGVTVSFASTGAKGFRSGDYWVFAARTTDASVEILDRAPPRGIHHHYARLGLWDVPGGTVTDCRTHWPPAGSDDDVDVCCTAAVTPESHASGSFTIQDGVNLVAQTGGTVCLAPGQYALREPVQMNGLRSVVVRGHGAATLVIAGGREGTGGGFIMRNCLASGIESLAVISAGGRPAISVNGAVGLRLRELVLAVPGTQRLRVSAIALSGIVIGASITDNAIFAAFGILANDPAAAEEGDTAPFLLPAALRIEDNVIWSRQAAILLGRRSWHLLDTSISGNDVIGTEGLGIGTTGRSLAGSSLDIRSNSIVVEGSGIASTLDGAWIADNKLVRSGPDDASDASIGISLGEPFSAAGATLSLNAGPDRNGIGACQILANQIAGFGGAGIRVGMPVRDLIIKLNIIERCGNGIITSDEARSGAISIENNHLTDIGPRGREIADFVYGIAVTRSDTVTVAHNSLRGIGLGILRADLRAGIFSMGGLHQQIAGNEVMEVGPRALIGSAAGILLGAPVTDFNITSNLVQRDALKDGADTDGSWSGIVVADIDPKSGFSKLATMTTVRLDAVRLLTLGVGRPFVAVLADASGNDRVVFAEGLIHGNTVNSRGRSAAVSVQVGDISFNDNRVVARLAGTAVFLRAQVAIVSGNRVQGGETSIQIAGVNPKTAAVLGNITSGNINVQGGLVSPWDALNLRV